MTVEIPAKDIAEDELADDDDITAEDIIKILDELPVGYLSLIHI